jgi:hypothetical protein
MREGGLGAQSFAHFQKVFAQIFAQELSGDD